MSTCQLKGARHFFISKLLSSLHITTYVSLPGCSGNIHEATEGGIITFMDIVQT